MPFSGPSRGLAPDTPFEQQKAPQASDLEGINGARGIRTPKPFRALAFEASAIPFCQRSKQPGAGRADGRETHAHRRQIGGARAGPPTVSTGPEAPYDTASRPLTNRGARIRTGDLCDPNAALYRTEPRPGTYRIKTTDGVGFEPTRAMPTRFPIVRLKPLGHPSKKAADLLHDRRSRREWDSNPRGVATNALAGRRRLGRRSRRCAAGARRDGTPGLSRLRRSQT